MGPSCGEELYWGASQLPLPLACLGLGAPKSSAFITLMGRSNKYFRVAEGLPWVLFIPGILATLV